MSDDPKFLVKYARNTSQFSASAEITFNQPGDDRLPIPLGGEGEVTQTEFNTLTAAGLVLERVDDGYDKLTKAELEDLASERGVDISSAKNNEERVQILRDTPARPDPEAADELPATAGSGTPPPTAAGAGGAAGPGGAAASGDAGTGGPSTAPGGAGV